MYNHVNYHNRYSCWRHIRVKPTNNTAIITCKHTGNQLFNRISLQNILLCIYFIDMNKSSNSLFYLVNHRIRKLDWLRLGEFLSLQYQIVFFDVISCAIVHFTINHIRQICSAYVTSRIMLLFWNIDTITWYRVEKFLNIAMKAGDPFNTIMINNNS